MADFQACRYVVSSKFCAEEKKNNYERWQDCFCFSNGQSIVHNAHGDRHNYLFFNCLSNKNVKIIVKNTVALDIKRVCI